MIGNIVLGAIVALVIYFVAVELRKLRHASS
jgi:hypothetical protein